MEIYFSICSFLFGICVGSFLNVVAFRLPKGESIVTGPSHCMTCGHRLKWYELIPVLSFVIQGGKCRSWDTLIAFGLVSALIALSLIDARTQEIPGGLNIFIACLGVLRIATDWHNFLLYLIGGAAVSVPLLIILFVTGGAGIGGGDVKLMAAAGLVLGWKNIILAFLLACIFGAVIHPIRMKFFHAGRVLAMGPYLSAGIMVAFLFGDAMISWYLGMMGL